MVCLYTCIVVFFWRLYLYRYVDQHYFATYGPSNNTDDLILTEARLSNTITLGATVNIAILSLLITTVDNKLKMELSQVS